MRRIDDGLDYALPSGLAAGPRAVVSKPDSQPFVTLPAAEQQRLIARGLERARVERAATFRAAARLLSERIGRGFQILRTAKRDIPRLQAEARRRVLTSGAAAAC
ncbi:MAG: hypothetical protein AAGJ70_11365 [Pseudomonadota bacterium]